VLSLSFWRTFVTNHANNLSRSSHASADQSLKLICRMRRSCVGSGRPPFFVGRGLVFLVTTRIISERRYGSSKRETDGASLKKWTAPTTQCLVIAAAGLGLPRILSNVASINSCAPALYKSAINPTVFCAAPLNSHRQLLKELVLKAAGKSPL
jgi:hypothetical protein